MTAGGGRPRGRLADAGCIAVLTMAFLWPALVTGAPWSFPDTASYYKGGAAAWAFAMNALGIADPGLAGADAAVLADPPPGVAGAEVAAPGAATATGASAPAATGQAAAEPNVRYGIRSVPYSLLVYVLVRFVSLWAPIVVTAAAIAGLVWLVARDLPRLSRLALGLGLAVATVLPFFGALFQPDILTAVIVLVPVAVMLHADRLGVWALLGLFAAMAYATLTHYANLPLAALALGWLGAWALLRRRRVLVALIAAPLAAAAVVNLAIGLVIGAGPSLAPGRYPLLLARSIEDGPGHAYLERVCPEAEWAICEVYDRIPSNVGAFLWGEDSIRERATPEQLARVSAEELLMLAAILRDDPAGQVGAFIANSARQFVLFHSAAATPTDYLVTPRTMVTTPLRDAPQPGVPVRLQLLVVLLGAAAAVAAVARRRHPEALATAAFLLAALVVFAAVCGGLSAPVPRYQARLIWLVPLLGAVLALAPRPAPRALTPATRAPAAPRA